MKIFLLLVFLLSSALGIAQEADSSKSQPLVIPDTLPRLKAVSSKYVGSLTALNWLNNSQNMYFSAQPNAISRQYSFLQSGFSAYGFSVGGFYEQFASTKSFTLQDILFPTPSDMENSNVSVVVALSYQSYATSEQQRITEVVITGRDSSGNLVEKPYTATSHSRVEVSRLNLDILYNVDIIHPLAFSFGFSLGYYTHYYSERRIIYAPPIQQFIEPQDWRPEQNMLISNTPTINSPYLYLSYTIGLRYRLRLASTCVASPYLLYHMPTFPYTYNSQVQIQLLQAGVTLGFVLK